MIHFEPSSGMISNDKFVTKLLENSDYLPICTNNKKRKVYNIPAAFDIEVTSFYTNGEKSAIMYEWSLGVLNWVTYGRTWQQFINVLDALHWALRTQEVNLIVYVHNLPYEWQFIRHRLVWSKVFFLDARKPVYAITDTGIEFRCSLKLSNKKLEYTADDLKKYPVEKMVGDLDYSLIRNDKTILSEKELKYCENDIRVLLSYIQEKIEQDGDILSIPLTNTGYVRNYCRKACYEKKRAYRERISQLTLEADEYIELKEAFQGGFTHANANKVDKVYTNVASYDFTSSYPSVMIAEKYPMKKGEFIGSATEEQIMELSKKYCCLFRCKFQNIVAITEVEHPISKSKCRNIISVIEDNGRLVAAKEAETTITEQDYIVISKFYSWEKIKIFDLIIYEKHYLPKAFIKAIIDLYKRKTELKDVEGEEINYMILKNMLNSAFGMTVTDIVREIYEYSEETGYTEKIKEMTKEEYRKELEKQINTYNKSWNRFLFYPWGVWVTAYARKNLFTGIYAIGTDYIYSDTDSIKFTNPDKHKYYFDGYNEFVLAKLKKTCETLSLDFSDLSPKNKWGVEKPIGVWDFEGIYTKFKTLGAKRYLVQTSKPDKHTGSYYKLTVAGVNKTMAMAYLEREYENPFDAFNSDLVVPKTDSGRNVLTYLDIEQEGDLTDYQGNISHYHEYSSIHMESIDYSFHRSIMFIQYLLGLYVKEESW